MKKIAQILGSWQAGSIVMSAVAICMAVEGTWGIDIHSSIPFYALVILLQICLAATLYVRYKNASIGFLLTHAGMLVMVASSFWGAPSFESGRVPVDYDTEKNLAYNDKGMAVTLPFSLKLDGFTIEYYTDSISPKQYTSRMIAKSMIDQGAEEVILKTSVNHPCRYKGYSIYQEGFDRENSAYSIIRVVRDPLLPFVYIGMLLLLIGSVMSLAGKWKMKVMIPAIITLAVIFTVASVAKINFGTLPPALRSWWFVPHLIVYMVAYSAMAISVVLCIIGMCWAKHSEGLKDYSDRLLRTSSVLLLVGMLCGAVWAKQAWGDYWTWDPKECWAGVTWLLTLVLMHLAPMKKKSYALLASVLLLAFLSLQITWYGVNHLPSAQESMHTYTK